MKCQCVEILAALRRTKEGCNLANCGVRCGACVDEIVEAKNELVRTNQRLTILLLEEREKRCG